MKHRDQPVDHLQQWSTEWVIKTHYKLDKQVYKKPPFWRFFCMSVVFIAAFFIP